MTPDDPEGPSGQDDVPTFTYDMGDGAEDGQGRRPRIDPWTIVLGIFGGVLLGTGVTLAVLGATGVFTEPTAPTLPPAPTLTTPPPTAPPISLVESNAAEVAQRAIPSIVSIEVGGFLGTAGGSGVVYGDRGYVVTNNHVVEGGGDIAVVFSDGARFPAEVIGTDPLTDLAVLSVARADLTSIDIGASGTISIGQPAIAVGNPLSLSGGPSVTSGIVSALNRTLEVSPGTELYGLIQTDAPITRGSSGGALLDGNARLIGITTAIAVSDVGAEGLGFAVPIDIASAVIDDLIEFGRVDHALLGISGRTAFAERDGAEFPVGVLVTGTEPGSAYEVAGGQINDVITSIDGFAIDTIDELLTRIRFLRAGEVATVLVLRGDAQLELEATMGLLE